MGRSFLALMTGGLAYRGRPRKQRSLLQLMSYFRAQTTQERTHAIGHSQTTRKANGPAVDKVHRKLAKISQPKAKQPTQPSAQNNKDPGTRLLLTKTK